MPGFLIHYFLFVTIVLVIDQHFTILPLSGIAMKIVTDLLFDERFSFTVSLALNPN
ncbi:MAG TPA: hypothetical protein VFD13_03370 [Candidatus Kapabacteria bacterium]|nr:hypothetical protein [Candidatus Kapabacteria bacterium]